MRFRRLIQALILTGVVSTLSGCGPGHTPTYAAGGKVRFSDGKPLAGGFVVFQSVGSKPTVSARGYVQADGTFRLGTFELDDGAIEGEHRALITPPGFVGDPDELLLRGLPLPVTVDVKYQAFDTSGFRCTVTRDSSQNQFELVMERPRK